MKHKIIHNINKLYHWILCHIVKIIVRQGHDMNIAEAFRIIIAASKKEFYEDSEITQQEFIRECFQLAIQTELCEYNGVLITFTHIPKSHWDKVKLTNISHLDYSEMEKGRGKAKL